MTFDPQEAPENFLALISPDCQQQSLDAWLTAVPRTRKVPGRKISPLQARKPCARSSAASPS